MSSLESRKYQLKNNIEVEFRHIAATDAESLLSFRESIPTESTHTLQYVGMSLPSLEETSSRLAHQENDPDILTLGCFYKNRLIGNLGFKISRSDHPWVKHIGEFGMRILKEYWGLGIGKILLKIMEEFARTKGITRIEAQVRTKNSRGINLYKHQGYRIEGLRKNAAYIDDQYVDEYYIAKILFNEDSWTLPVLKTARLILRPLELKDAPSIYDYAKNPEVAKYTLWEHHQSVQDSTNFIKDYAFERYRNKDPDPFAITLKGSPDKVIGTVGCFWKSKESRCLELAYALAQPLWGQGFIKEAAEAVIEYCQKEYKPLRIQATCKAENQASARVMQKLGMQFEGTLRSAVFHRERSWDIQIYSLIYNDYN